MVIDIGLVRDVGVVLRNPELLNCLYRSGMHILREQSLIKALVLALRALRLAMGEPCAASGVANC